MLDQSFLLLLLSCSVMSSISRVMLRPLTYTIAARAFCASTGGAPQNTGDVVKRVLSLKHIIFLLLKTIID